MTRDQFLRHLRDALNHLRDPERLRRNPLAILFGVADRVDAFSALQNLLIDAIAALEPPPDEPAQSRSWRIYESLYYRYVQQFSPQEVAEQLGIGVRHLRREQSAALEALADYLWRQFDLGKQIPGDAGPSSPEPGLSEETPSILDELAWLRTATIEDPTDLDLALASAIDLARPLARQHDVQLESSVPALLPGLLIHPVALSQILLNLLSAAIRAHAHGRIQISAAREGPNVVVAIAATAPHPTATAAADAALDLAAHLAQLCSVDLTITVDPGSWRARLAIAGLEHLPILALDDNADTLHLLQRYTAGTRYRLVVTRDPQALLPLAQRLAPRAIVLDVMMPQIDGWKVLGRLRQHPDTGQIPVVVCTILPQEELAFSLGASAYLRKPLKRADFLAALDRVTSPASGSR